jgi:two-component system chemotaxis sensor kinase CheA
VSAGTFDDSFIAEALPAFISEAQEQIETLEQLLLQLEDTPGNRDLLDALFRCAHTVKGSAGIFGLDRVVDFTHHVETLLDHVREGAVALTPELSTLLLQCNDQIRLLVAAASDPNTDTAEARQTRESIVRRLQAASGEGVASPVASNPTADTVAAASGAAAGGVRRWHVSVQFGTDTFRNGMDPLAVLNYVRGLGAVPMLACDLHAVPALSALDPETCHLAFEFSLDTGASREQVESAFSFVRDDCTLRVIGPEAGPQDFVALIAAMPDNPRIGDILVAVGAISQEQLRQGLQAQAGVAGQEGRNAPLGQILQTSAGLSPRVVEAALQKQSKQRD